MLLPELKAYLVGLGTLTYTIRLGYMPEDISECICLREVGGTGVELGFGVDGVQYEFPVVSVEARGDPEEYETARAQLELCFQALPKIQAQSLTSGGETGYYHTVIPRQAPFLAYMDENRRPVLAFVVDVHKEPSA